MTRSPLQSSRALWNRQAADLDSNETLAQILDRGNMDDWRCLFRYATANPSLRRRIVQTVTSVPTPLPRFWLAAMASLGEQVARDVSVPEYDASWF